MNYQDHLEQTGAADPGVLACQGCGRVWPTFALDIGAHDNSNHEILCNPCIQAERLPRLAEEARAAIVDDPWANTKVRRNAIVDRSLWTVVEGSPLTDACRLDWAAYIASLHRLTIDYPTPDDVVWPDEPDTEYADPA